MTSFQYQTFSWETIRSQSGTMATDLLEANVLLEMAMTEAATRLDFQALADAASRLESEGFEELRNRWLVPEKRSTLLLERGSN
jgi:hypothetical protein